MDSLSLETNKLLEKSKLWLSQELKNNQYYNTPLLKQNTAYFGGIMGMISMMPIVYAAGSGNDPVALTATTISLAKASIELMGVTAAGVTIGSVGSFLGDNINKFLNKLNTHSQDIYKEYLLNGEIKVKDLSGETKSISRKELAEDAFNGTLSNKYSQIVPANGDKAINVSDSKLNVSDILKISFEPQEQILNKKEKSSLEIDKEDINLQVEMFHRAKFLSSTNKDEALAHLSALKEIVDLKKSKKEEEDNGINLKKSEETNTQTPAAYEYGNKSKFIEKIKFFNEQYSSPEIISKPKLSK